MNTKIEEFSGNNLHGNNILFRTVCFEFEYKEDKQILETIENRGYKLAAKVNPAAANHGDINRLPEQIKRNCVAGVLAEYCWKYIINKIAEREVVLETEFTNSSIQIDLITNNTNKKIEVRSSFPRNGVEFAIFNRKYQFDILGPYSNTVKQAEIQKDYYIRTLYPFESKDFFSRFNTSIAVYLTGGATWDMMISSNFSKIKDLVPEDNIIDNARRSTYRVVPLSLALDTITIVDTIIS